MMMFKKIMKVLGCVILVMPEEAWEESDTIYLKISQGIDGDHHSEKLGGARTVGIYASYDNGKTFEFVREEAELEEE